MDEKPQEHRSADPTPWQQALKSAKEELRWLLETMGMVTLTLALGRIIQKLGLDISHLTSTSWHELVKRVLQQEEDKP